MSQFQQEHSKARYAARRITALVVLAIGAWAFVAGQSASASNSSTAGVEFTTITVLSGETLWQLAEEHAPGQDSRDWIAKVIDLNALDSVEIHPGQTLALPAN